MTSSTDTKLMDTAPGGDNTQYESINTVTEGESTAGSLNNEPSIVKGSDADKHQKKELQERGAKTAENIRYGQSISEHGYGGNTVDNSGKAGQEGGYGGVKDTKEDAGDSRAAMGYGSGNDIGG